MNRAAIEEAIEVLEKTPIDLLTPVSSQRWADGQGRVCPVRAIESHFKANDWRPLKDHLGVASHVITQLATAYDNSRTRRQGKNAVIEKLRSVLGLGD